MNKIKSFFCKFLENYNNSEADFASSFLAYHLLLSFIPMLMFLSQVLVNIIPNFKILILNSIENLPNDVQNIVIPIFNSVLNTSSSLSIIAIISSLWLASRGFLGLLKSLNKILEINTKSKENINSLYNKIPFFEKIFSVIYTIVFLILLVLLLLFAIFNNKILLYISNITNDFYILSEISDNIIIIIGFLTPLILSILLFASLYKFAPILDKSKSIPWKNSFLGATIATFGIGLMTFFYKFTNDTLQRSPSYYGSLGSLLVTLVWLLTICQMIIVGAVFIKTISDK